MSRGRARVFGETASGRLSLDRQELAEQVRQLPDGPVEVIVRHLKADSSYRQMQKYWHAVPVEVCRKSSQIGGLTHDAMHYTLLGEWRGWMEGPTGHEVPICSASRKLDREEWTELIGWVLEWGPSEHGLEIPEPDSARALAMTEQYHKAVRDEAA